MSTQQSQPILNVPGAVSIVILLIVGIHLILSALIPPAEGNLWTLRLAFIPTRFTEAGLEFPGGAFARYWQFFTHQFVHADWLHVGMNCAWLLAFGSGIARRAGNMRFLVFSLACGIAGILTFWMLNPHLAIPVIGASGAVSGMMAGALRFVFSAQMQSRAEGRPVQVETVRLASITELIRVPAVVMLVVAWIGINYIFGVIGFGAPDTAQIAWEAHLGGFLFGLFAYGYFDRRRDPSELDDPPIYDDYEDDEDDNWREGEWPTGGSKQPPPGTTVH